LISRLFLACALASLVPGVARSQMPAPTDIYLVRFADLDSAGTVAVTQLTQRAGYDNQPFFTPDGRYLLYSAIMPDLQADIFRIDLNTRKEERLTKTPESEFSPTPLPDGSGFSAVRVQADSTQRLWKFPYKGKPAPILEKVRGVGYHAWADSDHLLLFLLHDPYLLVLANARTGDTTVVAENIGRSMAPIPGRSEVSFIKNEGHARWIDGIDPTTRKVERIAPAPEGSEDFAWTPGGRLLMAQGLILSEWNAATKQWETLAVLGNQVPGRITRLAVSPDGKWLALVADEKTTP
jgi:WD40-like Beta Propeller Repeat